MLLEMRAGGRISHRSYNCRAWPLSGYGCAGPGRSYGWVLEQCGHLWGLVSVWDLEWICISDFE